MSAASEAQGDKKRVTEGAHLAKRMKALKGRYHDVSPRRRRTSRCKSRPFMVNSRSSMVCFPTPQQMAGRGPSCNCCTPA